MIIWDSFSKPARFLRAKERRGGGGGEREKKRERRERKKEREGKRERERVCEYVCAREISLQDA